MTGTGPGGRQDQVPGADGASRAAGLAPGDAVVTAALPGVEAVEIPVACGAGATETIPIGAADHAPARNGQRGRRGAPDLRAHPGP